MIRVLVVEDSPTVREFLTYILAADPEIEVVGTAGTGEEALEAVEHTRPDVVTMDVHMPKMNGLDATRKIMENLPTPIVIVSGQADATSTAKVFRAIEAGALAVLPRPHGAGHPQHEQSVTELVRTVKLMSEVRLVRRWPRSRAAQTQAAGALSPEIQLQTAPRQIQLVAIGASTGGPPMLQMILSGLPSDFPFPVMIVQHMAAGFTQGFVEWLSRSSHLPIHTPVHGEYVVPGHVYVAPDGVHMAVGADRRVSLNSADPENGLRPSVSHLFRSVAKSYGETAIGILLTGMGKDGAWELKLMRDRGALTIAQDRETSVVHGMPGEAIRLGAAKYVLTPERICAVLARLAERNANIGEPGSS